MDFIFLFRASASEYKRGDVQSSEKGTTLNVKALQRSQEQVNTVIGHVINLVLIPH